MEKFQISPQLLMFLMESEAPAAQFYTELELKEAQALQEEAERNEPSEPGDPPGPET